MVYFVYDTRIQIKPRQNDVTPMKLGYIGVDDWCTHGYGPDAYSREMMN